MPGAPRDVEAPCSTGGMEQYAIKLFNVRKDYDLELDLYQDEALRKVLPAIYHASDNADGAAQSIRCAAACTCHAVVSSGCSCCSASCMHASG